jgi:Dolichyl-phosphate-mannose-protein mannosyltransferase
MATHLEIETQQQADPMAQPLALRVDVVQSPHNSVPQSGWSLGPNTSLAILIMVSLVLRLVWAAGIGLCNDEAYHYLFTVHPDWSYFDHPPMTMWIEWLGLTACGGWVHPLSLRLGFVLLMAGSTWIMARLTARWYGAWAGFYAALLLNLTIYYGGAGAFALPDPPLLFFALLVIWALGKAIIDQPGQTLPWVWVGLAFAGALLSKYHAIFFPMAAFLYLVLTPGARFQLRRPGPYLAFAIGSLGFAPVLIWNAEHGWLSFVFQGSRAVGTTFRISGLLSTILGPAVYLFPWTWLLCVSILFHRLRNFRTVEGPDRLLVCLAVVPITIFLLISPLRDMLPHWSLIGFVALLPLAGARWAKWSAENPKRVRRWVVGISTAIVLICGVTLAHGRFGIVQFSFKDPLTEMSGWDSLGPELKARGLIGQPKTFLFTDRWYESGQLAFAVRSEAPVLCYNFGDSHGFAQWSDPDDWVGWDGVLITTRDCRREMRILRMFFEKIELIDEFPMTRGGAPFRTVRVWRCTHQERPFPFRYGDTLDFPDEDEPE